VFAKWGLIESRAQRPSCKAKFVNNMRVKAKTEKKPQIFIYLTRFTDQFWCF
jgi:hypothetical protein